MHLLTTRQPGGSTANAGRAKNAGPVATFFAWLIMVLFLGAFVAAGAWTTWLCAQMLVRAAAMRGWQELPARVLEAELITRRGSKSTTFQARAEYEYEFDGVRHVGTRVAVSSGGDNIGKFQKNVAALLRQHQATGKPIACYVNPDDPDESVLFRDIRPEQLLLMTAASLIFGTIGVSMLMLLVINSLEATRDTRYAQQALAEHPSEPWLVREDWASRRIESKPGSPRRVALLVVASIWNFIGTLSWVLVPGVTQGRADAITALGLIFTGWVVAWLTWRAWRSQRRSTLTLAENPVPLGGHLRGQLETNMPPDVLAGYALELRCQQLATIDRRQGTPMEKTLWSKRLEIPPTFPGPDFGTLTFAVELAIPPDAPPTRPGDDQNLAIAWRLALVDRASGSGSGKPAARFELPVFVGQRQEATN